MFKKICQNIFPVNAILSQRPENSDRSERTSKISGQCDKIATTGKNLSVRPSVFPVVAIKSQRPENSNKSERTSKISGRYINRKKLVCPTVRFFLFVLPGTGLWAAGSLPLSVRLLRRQNFGSSLAKFVIFGFAGNDLDNDLAVTPANFSLPRQKIARLRNDSKDCAEANLHKSFST